MFYFSVHTRLIQDVFSMLQEEKVYEIYSPTPAAVVFFSPAQRLLLDESHQDLDSHNSDLFAVEHAEKKRKKIVKQIPARLQVSLQEVESPSVLRLKDQAFAVLIYSHEPNYQHESFQ